MEYRKLGSSDLSVSPFAIGAMGFGRGKGNDINDRTWGATDDQVKEVVKRALDMGINFFDTAPVYQHGGSERLLGKILKQEVSRDKFVVATKFEPRSPEAVSKGVPTKEYMTQSLNQSLKNLGLDYVDLFIYHMWDWYTPIEEQLKVLADLVKEGKIRYIGMANVFPWQVAEANEIAKREGYPQFVSVQNYYNLLYREDDREMLNYARLHNISLTPYSPLAGGLLTRPFGTETERTRFVGTFSKFDHSSAMPQADLKIIELVGKLAAKYKVEPAAIALSWLTSRVTAPIVGATKVRHLVAIEHAQTVHLSQDEGQQFDQLYAPHDLTGVMSLNNSRENSWQKNMPDQC